MALPFNQSRTNKNSGKKLFFRIFFVGIFVFMGIVFGRTILRGMSAVRQSTEEILAYTTNLATPKKILIAQIETLRDQEQQLQSQVAHLQLIEDENTSLRTLLDYPKSTHTMITARVIARPSQNLYDRIMIDRGTRDGVVIGDRIIAGENGVIATVDQVTETTAQGTLISGSFWKGDAVIARLGITVPVVGKGSGNFELHVPRDLDVRDGDVMTLPGSPEFIFGMIKSVTFDERDPYQTVLARTPVNVQELKFVRVVK